MQADLRSPAVIDEIRGFDDQHVTVEPAGGKVPRASFRRRDGDSGTPTHYIEGTISRVLWNNPHIFINIVTSGGEVEAGENWRLTTHPINIMEGTYGFRSDEFQEGDEVKVYGWFHLRGQPLFQIRAISVDDGPMQSTLRFSDLRDIVKGTLADQQIIPTRNINGTSPARAGAETVQALGEMGYLDEQGNVSLPDEILYPDYSL